jgi:hypothetical protein
VPHSGVTSLFRSFCNLFQKIAAKGVVRAADRAIRLPDDLGDDVEVTDGRKKCGQIAERTIHVYLLKVGLGQSSRVITIFIVGPFQKNLAVAEHPFLAQEGTALLVLIDRNLVYPA